MTRLADNAELLVSELVTNAITASRALGDYLPIRPYLLSDAARVVIMVWDPQQSKQELTQDGGGQSP